MFLSSKVEALTLSYMSEPQVEFLNMSAPFPAPDHWVCVF